jgi:hypothetical protein
LDFETTGLSPGKETILELAYCITDDQHRLLTPIRQRLTNLAPPLKREAGPRGPFGFAFDTTKSEDWENPEFFDTRNKSNPKIVMDMHQNSGLKADHLAVDPNAILTHPRDFERMFLDDLVDVKNRFDYDIGKIILSGDGVSHFDNYLLDALWPDRFPLRPDFDHDMAYWYGDVSIARRLVPPSVLTAGRKWAESDESPFSMLAEEMVADISMGPDDFEVQDEKSNLWTFDRNGAVPHRAADDLVVSILDARILAKIDLFSQKI